MKSEREGRTVAVRVGPSPPAQVSNGDAVPAVLAECKPGKPEPVVTHHFSRPPTSSGGRNMQDTTFSLSADYPSKYNIYSSEKCESATGK